MQCVRPDRLMEEDQDTYDAFVVYAPDDLEWIIHTLRPKVEEDWGLKLCINDRDFVPGVPIADNIVNGVDSSRLTLLVLTQQFTTDEWCDFQLHMALSKPGGGRKTLVMCYMEDIPVEMMFPTLRSMMRGIDYIPWGDTELGHTRFWRRLHDALTE